MKTFQERLTDHEDKRHASRVAEIVAVSDLLAAADRYIQEAEARLDLEIRIDQRLMQFLPVPTSVNIKKALYLSVERYTLSDQRLYDVLLSLGFMEIERSNVSGLFDLAHLQLNDLIIAVTCDSSSLPNQSCHDVVIMEYAAETTLSNLDRRLMV